MPFHQGLTRPQGDPGFFSFIGKALGTVARAIPGPIGAIATAITRPSGQRPPGPSSPPIAAPMLPVQAAPLRLPVPGVVGAAQRLVPGGQTGFVDCPGGAPRGMHLNKSDYHLKDGTFIPKGSRFVPNRRRDPLNIRALRKANSRQRGFLRAVDTTLKTMPTKAGVSKRRRQIGGAK